MNKRTPLKRLSDLLIPHKSEISAIYFYAILSGLVQLSLPLGVQAIIGFVLGASMVTSIYILIALVVLGTFLVGVFQMNQMKLIEKIQQSIFTLNALEFAEKIPRFNLFKTDHYYLPEKVNRFFDTINVQKGLTKILLDMPVATIQIGFGLILLSFYHPLFIIYGLLLILTLYIIFRLTAKKGLRTSLQESTYKYSVVAWLQEMARVIRSLKFSKNEGLYIKKTDHDIMGYLNARTAHFNVLIFQYKSLIAFKVLITAGMLIVGTYLLLDQQLNIGEFIAAEIVIITMINAAEKLIVCLDSVYDVVTGLEKLATVTEIPLEKEGHLEITPLVNGLSLELNDVSFNYPEGKHLIKNVHLTIPAASLVYVVGNSGSGKSTFLKLIGGLYSDFEGTLLINKFPLDHYHLSALRKHIGMYLNLQEIFTGTVFENIRMGKEDVTPEKIIEVANKCGLKGFLFTLPDGLDTEIEATGKKLPGSIVRKILLLRALIGEPKLLLLEEPWQGLEQSIKIKLIEYLQNLSKSTTVVIATNDEQFAQLSDHTIYLEEGTATFKSKK